MPRPPKAPPTEEGKRLRKAREEAGFATQQALAEALGRGSGITRGYIARLESSEPQNPTIGKVRRLAEALDVNPAWLVGWSDRKARRG